MKLVGRTLAIMAAALVVVGFWLAIGSLSGSTGAMAGGMGGHGMGSGVNLAGIVDILPTLAIVAIVTAIVSPLKQRLLAKRVPAKVRPSMAARRPLVAAQEA